MMKRENSEVCPQFNSSESETMLKLLTLNTLINGRTENGKSQHRIQLSIFDIIFARLFGIYFEFNSAEIDFECKCAERKIWKRRENSQLCFEFRALHNYTYKRQK